MAENINKFNDSYTRKVSGEYFEYQVEYTAGEHVEWYASVYHDAVLKGKPSGSIESNTLKARTKTAPTTSICECARS